MPQPDKLTESLGDLRITATEKGYIIVDIQKNETKALVQEPFAICAKTNMQRALLRAQQIMEEEEKKEAIKARIAKGDASDFDGDGETARGVLYEDGL